MVNYQGGIRPGKVFMPWYYHTQKPWYTMVIFTMVYHGNFHHGIPPGICAYHKKPWYTMVIHTIWYTMVHHGNSYHMVYHGKPPGITIPKNMVYHMVYHGNPYHGIPPGITMLKNHGIPIPW